MKVRFIPVGGYRKGKVCQSKDRAAHNIACGIEMERGYVQITAGIALFYVFNDCAHFGSEAVGGKALAHLFKSWFVHM